MKVNCLLNTHLLSMYYVTGTGVRNRSIFLKDIRETYSYENCSAVCYISI